MTSTNTRNTGSQSTFRIAVLCAFTVALIATGIVFAMSGKHNEFHGVIQVRPADTLQGKWAIGGRVFVTDSETKFDQLEGKLDLGSCAEVDIGDGRVHAIDSEPMRDCR